MTNGTYSIEECRKAVQETGFHLPLCVDLDGAPTDYCAKAVPQEAQEFCVKRGTPNWPLEMSYCRLPDGTIKMSDPHSKDPAGDCAAAGGSMASCLCCCADMYGAVIALSEGQEELVSEVGKGRQVLAGAFGPGGDVVWDQAAVTFSDGSRDQQGERAVRINLGPGATPSGTLVCSPDQPILLHDGTLVSASRLHRRDTVMGADGNAVPVHSVETIEIVGGLHHLGVGRPDDGAHLLRVANMVIGDYYLQLRPDLLADRWAADAQERPHVWEPGYARTDAKS
ncbi:hypothetical protein ACFXGA_09700 [Actinosynnema sp. NPDC059335]|uniref:hypothetical protein n=1 Tax=Actinosynnema sp. NPDC059335 TaxID=3346804 RepID=UPI0036707EA3